MNKQDVDVYVVLPQGTYLYDAKAHQLNLVAEGDHRDAVAGGQAFVKTAPVSLLLVSDLSRLGLSKEYPYSIDGGGGCRYRFTEYFYFLCPQLIWRLYRVLRWILQN